MDYIELSFFFKVQPDVAEGVLVELSVWECYYFFLFVCFLFVLFWIIYIYIYIIFFPVLFYMLVL